MCIPNSLLTSQLRSQFTSIVLINELIEKQKQIVSFTDKEVMLKNNNRLCFCKNLLLAARNSVQSGILFTRSYVCACVCVIK